MSGKGVALALKYGLAWRTYKEEPIVVFGHQNRHDHDAGLHHELFPTKCKLFSMYFAAVLLGDGANICST